MTAASSPMSPPCGPPMRILLHQLVDLCGIKVGAEDMRMAGEAADLATGPWTERLETAASGVGLRLHWVTCSAPEAAALSEDVLPVVTVADPGMAGQRWVVLSGRSFGRVRVHTPPAPVPTVQMLPSHVQSQLLGGQPSQIWALVEPALPASPVLPRDRMGPAPTPVQRLRALFRSEKRDITAVIIYGVATGVVSLAIPLTMQVLINWLAFGALAQPVIALTVVLLFCLLLGAALRGLQRLAVEMIQRRIFVRMMADLATRLTRVRVAAFDTQYGPELVNRFFDVLTVQKAIASLFIHGLGAALQAAVGLTLLAFYHPVLLAYDVVIVIALAGILFVLGKGAQKTAIKESKAKYAAASWFEELARHPIGFKLGNGQRLALEKTDALAQSYLVARDAHWRVYFRQFGGSLALQAVASVLLLALCGWLVLEGQLSVGQLVAAEFIVTSALAGFAKFADKFDTFYDLLAGIDKLGTLVDLPQERVSGLPAHPDRAEAAEVRLDRVVVQQPGGSRRLGPVDLEVPPGGRVAVLGRPGVGKSALAEVLLGLRRPREGTVWRDGLRAEDLRPSVLYKDCMLAGRIDIIHGTVGENVALGRPEATILEQRRALALVGLSSVVGDLPDEIHTVLGPEGRPLSSSHARRLMLARALCARPRLLVVDGLLDAVLPEERERLLAPLIGQEAPWTLIVFTEQAEVAAMLPRLYSLTPDGLDVAP